MAPKLFTSLLTTALLIACILTTTTGLGSPSLSGPGDGGVGPPDGGGYGGTGGGTGGGESSETCAYGKLAEICRVRGGGRNKCLRRFNGGPEPAGWRITGEGRKKKCCLTDGAFNSFPTARNCYSAGKTRRCSARCVN